MVHLHFSNRLPPLTAALLEQLAAGQRGVFDRDDVLVPNTAVRRALQLALADTHGVCAGVNFDNLGTWMWRQVARLVPDVEGDSPFRPERLTWQVLAVLNDAAFTDGWPRLSRYLRGDDPVMRYELAVRIAALFDQYVTYRSDWLEDWSTQTPAPLEVTGSAREDADWQAALWRTLLARLGAADRHPRKRFLAALTRPDSAAHLPPTVHVFALPSIPPLHVESLGALAARMDVHVYVLNPCAEYWGEIVGPKRLAQLRLSGRDEGHEVGNPLLAAWAGPTRDHFRSLVGAFGDGMTDAGSSYAEPGGDTMLARLQRAILHLEELPVGSLVRAEDDRSLEIHVCHSLTRQLEVAVDRLLGLFDTPPGDGTPLRPSDVLIAVPDLDVAAPLVEAVFGALPEARRLPVQITGRSRTRTESVVRVLDELLALAESRLEADAVWTLLARPPVARRFGLDAQRLVPLREWFLKSGFCWGLDEHHRSLDGLPDHGRYTLDAGMDRLFLSYALPAEQAEPVAGARLPAPGVRDPAGEDLAALDAFAGVIGRFVTAAAQSRTAADWAALLDAVTDELISPEPLGAEVEELRQARATVRSVCELMGAAEPIATHPLGVVRAALTAAFDEAARGGVPTGAVTVSSLSSLRGLSFRVVCLLGLDDDVFPRADTAVDFDLMAAVPFAGDRQRRADDRNLFLDHLVATHDVVHLSYTGFSDRTNAPLPPSAVLSELLDAVLPAAIPADLSGETRKAAARRAREQLVIAHPLQPFSTAYFNTEDPHRQSFQEELAAAQRTRLARTWSEDLAIAAEPGVDTDAAGATTDEGEADAAADGDDVRDPQRPFVVADLTGAAPVDDLLVTELQRFFWHPAAYFLRRRLGLTFAEEVTELPTDEPLQSDYARERAVSTRLLDAALRGDDVERLVRRVAASADTAPGVLGEVTARQWAESAVAFAARIRALTQDPVEPVHEVRLPLAVDGRVITLTGAWGDLRAAGLVRHSARARGPAELLGTWIEHLVLNAAPPPTAPIVTQHLFRNELVRLPPLESSAAAVAELQTLVALYLRGQSAPLHFYPKSAWAYVTDTKGRPAARQAWEPRAFGKGRGESHHEAYALALRGVDNPLDADFEQTAEAVFRPLVMALQEPT